MAGLNAFGKGFLQTVNRIAFVQVAERRRDPERAEADFIDRVATRAIGTHEGQSTLHGRLPRLRECGGSRQGAREGQRANRQKARHLRLRISRLSRSSLRSASSV